MNLSRTAAALLGVLVLLIAASTYLWLWVGTGKPEVDSRIATTLQNFTCAKCGHNFAMTMAEVSRMRRNRGQICCPKCGEGGAHKDLMNRGSAGQPIRPVDNTPSGSGVVTPAPAAGIASDNAAVPTPVTTSGPAGAPSDEGGDTRHSASQ
jgi:hypothetical protein